MKIPKSIQVAGHNIPVQKGGVDSDATGHFEHDDDFSIAIQEGLGKDLEGETLFHEIVEAINHIYELNLSHSKIQTLGASFYQAVKPLLKTK